MTRQPIPKYWMPCVGKVYRAKPHERVIKVDIEADTKPPGHTMTQQQPNSEDEAKNSTTGRQTPFTDSEMLLIAKARSRKRLEKKKPWYIRAWDSLRWKVSGS